MSSTTRRTVGCRVASVAPERSIARQRRGDVSSPAAGCAAPPGGRLSATSSCAAHTPTLTQPVSSMPPSRTSGAAARVASMEPTSAADVAQPITAG